ncbi:MAG: hypothetical protein R3C68_08930 [Myxococcota bacterium]
MGQWVASIDILDAVVQQPPTFFDSEKKQMLWGPWDNDDGVGTVMVLVTDEGEDADFRYSYVFFRGMSQQRQPDDAGDHCRCGYA